MKISLLSSLIGIAAITAQAGPAASPGNPQIYSNIYTIGVEWPLSGDSDHDARCTVQFREKGQTTYRKGMDLFRVDFQWNWQHENNRKKENFNMLAGSIMHLKPNTVYQVRLQMNDPDGGSATRDVEIRTRPIPSIPSGGKTYHVVPGTRGGKGTAADPFHGVDAAMKVAQPGDTILIHKGDYPRFNIKKSGKPGKYIVFKGAGDGPAVFPKAWIFNASHIWIEGLTFKYQGKRMDNGQEGGGLHGRDGCRDVVVVRNTFRTFYYNIWISKQCADWYVADNDIVGNRTNIDILPPGTDYRYGGEGVMMNNSSGHTIAHNSISVVADGMSFPGRNVDIFGNDIFNVVDDGIELDMGYANVRIWGNRLYNCLMHNFSYQPQYCGPHYIVRNQVITSKKASAIFKFRIQDQFLFANNSIIMRGRTQYQAQAFLRSYSRNNLWIFPPNYKHSLWEASNPSAKTIQIGNESKDSINMKPDWRTNVDYDGFDWNDTKYPFLWYGKKIATLPELAKHVGIEKNAKKVSRDELYGKNLALNERTVLALRAGSGAIDAGVAIPNIVEDFNGRAPDLGAYEFGAPLPIYGPRKGNGNPPPQPEPEPVARPAAPSNLVAKANGSTAISLTWNDQSKVEEGQIIERSTDGSSFSQLTTLGANVTSFTNNKLIPGRKYYYRIKAFNSGGSSSYSNLASDTTEAALSKPAAPESLVATAASNSRINLTWVDASNNEDGFTLLRSADGKTFTVAAQLGSDRTSFGDPGLKAATQYHYRLEAHNKAGKSRSNAAKATTLKLIGKPTAPVKLVATALSPNSIRLTWEDSSNVENGFQIERSIAGGVFQSLTAVGANVTAFENNSLKPEAKYQYRVRAQNSAGVSAYSNPASATTPALVVRPKAPKNVKSTVISANQVELGWEDDADNEKGFWVRRSTDGEKFAVIASLPENSTAYADQDASAATRYYYKVTAHNDAGYESSPMLQADTPAVARPVVLFVVGSLPYGPGDAAVAARMEVLGFEVRADVDNIANVANADGASLILVSSTVLSTTMMSDFRTTAIPLICWEPYLFDNLGMTGPEVGVDYSWINEQTSIHVNGTSSLIAEGVGGRQQVFANPGTMPYAVPGKGAHVVATITGEAATTCIFTYKTGAPMVGMTAPAKRVGIFLGDNGAANLTPEGWKLFDQTVAWAAMN
jgi:fibronectin type 3 domain-containing protein